MQMRTNRRRRPLNGQAARAVMAPTALPALTVKAAMLPCQALQAQQPWHPLVLGMLRARTRPTWLLLQSRFAAIPKHGLFQAMVRQDPLPMAWTRVSAVDATQCIAPLTQKKHHICSNNSWWQRVQACPSGGNV